MIVTAISKAKKTATPNTLDIPILIFLLLLVYGAFSQYFLLSAMAGISLSIIFHQFSKPYIPAALLFYFVMQWFHIFSTILFSDYINESIAILYDAPNYLPLLIMSFLQISIMAIVAGYYFNKGVQVNSFSIKRASLQLNTRRIIFGYLIATLIFPTLLAVTRSNPSVNQLVQAFGVLRSVFIVLLIFILFTRRDNLKGVIVAILAIEFIIGFTSFFSSFKDIIFLIIIVYLTITPRLKASLFLKLSPIIILLIVGLSFWQSVKGDYRLFLSSGSGLQQVTVGKQDALLFLKERAETFDVETFNLGIEEMISRAVAFKYYLLVHERVPEVLPHTKGKMLKENLMFIMVPRSLNPDKGILDPSVNTAIYTGQEFKTASEGTSIALGYFCDLYIDYGLWVMIIPLMILGALIGKLGNFFLTNRKYNRLFAYSLLISIVISFGSVESDTLFMLGILRNLIVFILLGKWFIFPWINKKIVV